MSAVSLVVRSANDTNSSSSPQAVAIDPAVQIVLRILERSRAEKNPLWVLTSTSVSAPTPTPGPAAGLIAALGAPLGAPAAAPPLAPPPPTPAAAPKKAGSILPKLPAQAPKIKLEPEEEKLLSSLFEKWAFSDVPLLLDFFALDLFETLKSSLKATLPRNKYQALRQNFACLFFEVWVQVLVHSFNPKAFSSRDVDPSELVPALTTLDQMMQLVSSSPEVVKKLALFKKLLSDKGGIVLLRQALSRFEGAKALNEHAPEKKLKSLLRFVAFLELSFHQGSSSYAADFRGLRESLQQLEKAPHEWPQYRVLRQKLFALFVKINKGQAEAQRESTKAEDASSSSLFQKWQRRYAQDKLAERLSTLVIVILDDSVIQPLFPAFLPMGFHAARLISFLFDAFEGIIFRRDKKARSIFEDPNFQGGAAGSVPKYREAHSSLSLPKQMVVNSALRDFLTQVEADHLALTDSFMKSQKGEIDALTRFGTEFRFAGVFNFPNCAVAIMGFQPLLDHLNQEILPELSALREKRLHLARETLRKMSLSDLQLQGKSVIDAMRAAHFSEDAVRLTNHIALLRDIEALLNFHHPEDVENDLHLLPEPLLDYMLMEELDLILEQEIAKKAPSATAAQGAQKQKEPEAQPAVKIAVGEKLRKIQTLIERCGFNFVRQNGSHLIYQKEGGGVIVIPNHRNLKPGTIKNVERQAAAAAAAEAKAKTKKKD
jgi:predicted RNA binding protein YcfA (HicA-like mRNA interferase family)